jgi:hypothetical protein
VNVLLKKFFQYFSDESVWENPISVTPLPENETRKTATVKIFNHTAPLQNVGAVINRFSKVVTINELKSANDWINIDWTKIFSILDPVEKYCHFIVILLRLQKIY